MFFRAPRFEDGVKSEDARITLIWNGVTVHDNVAVPHATAPPLDATESATGILRFQDYRTEANGPVRLRNVWIREWSEAPGAWKPAEWTQPLTDKGNWTVRGGQATFTLEDGVLRGETRPNTPNTFFTSQTRHADFELLYEFRVHPELNSGVQIRSEVQGGFEKRSGGLQGYQVEIDPSKRAWTAGLYEEAGRGWVNPLHAAPYARRAFQQGEWNRVRVLAQGSRIRTWLNGIPAGDLFDAQRIDGHIGFQVHGVGKREDPLSIEWRKVRLRGWAR